MRSIIACEKKEVKENQLFQLLTVHFSSYFFDQRLSCTIFKHLQTDLIVNTSENLEKSLRNKNAFQSSEIDKAIIPILHQNVLSPTPS